MGIVSFLVEAADEGLETVAESQFAAITSGMGAAVMLAATLAIILLFVNMAYQFKPMDMNDLIPLLIKIGLINAFAFNWVNFNVVSSFITDGLDNLAGTILGSITGDTGAGAAYFAGRFDQVLDDLADHANAIGDSLPWMAGALLSVFFTALLALVGGVAGVILVLAKAMVAFLIGLAPVMIAMSLFRATQDYFQRWLAAIISWSFYPVVIAGTMSVIFGLFSVLQSRVGGVENLGRIGAALPFLAVVMVSLGMVLAIPVIVRTLTGDINSGWAASAVGAGIRKMTQPQRPQQRNQSPTNTTSDTSRRLNAGPDAARSPSSATDSRPSTGTGAKMQRMMDRAERLSADEKKK
ncbi:type IV secretion system protein [Aquicoccus porphyridii]|uniref:Type IV secretion system protein n=1 Tax=Aquicoccus porphyridii TaxID=1852029 RepID=A0A5A9ZD17_9RHOB|nr:type IV secretion system protein [Aquicoccus porphyridii]KAA0914872.1 type IV secretion system protein [Aquicoccus porphyridii]RAI52582.1 hypothetical protein DOO74_17355 [Rhodobacteraceae bacterium AsT-22]